MSSMSSGVSSAPASTPTAITASAVGRGGAGEVELLEQHVGERAADARVERGRRRRGGLVGSADAGGETSGRRSVRWR